MSKRKLEKDEYIDRYGQVQRHSKWYLENRRRKRVRTCVAGAALVVVLGVLVAAGMKGSSGRSDRDDIPAENERIGAADTALAAGENGEGVTGEENVQQAEKAEADGEISSEASEISLNGIMADGVTENSSAQEDASDITQSVLSRSDPDLFYPGYKTYSDASTQMITSETIISSYCVLVDLKDGHIVAGRDANERMVPASMTKVLTILTAADLVEDPDDTFVITQEICDYVWRHKCSQAGYQPDEEVTVRELFYATILPSGGDAACALAYYTCGSIEAFADKMNEKCAELGIADVAHFTNPAGIYDDENYCTPASMAMIMKAAEENEFLREVLGTRIYTTAETEQHPEGIELSNWFIRRIEDKDTHGTVLGAKTGFVNESGNCAVSYLRSNDGNQYICVTGNAWSAWRAIYDHVEIYDTYVN